MNASAVGGFDLSDLLAAVEGDVELARLAATQFLAQGDALPQRLDDALAVADAGSAARVAHEIKGMAAMLGATSLSSAAAALEAALRDGRLDTADGASVRMQWGVVAASLRGFVHD